MRFPRKHERSNAMHHELVMPINTAERHAAARYAPPVVLSEGLGVRFPFAVVGAADAVFHLASEGLSRSR